MGRADEAFGGQYHLVSWVIDGGGGGDVRGYVWVWALVCCLVGRLIGKGSTGDE